MTLTLLLGAYVLFIYLLMRAKSVGATPFLLTATSLLPIYIGYTLIQGTPGMFTLGGYTALLAGYLAVKLRAPSPASAPEATRTQPAALLVAAFVLYHLVAGGVPLFSDNVELARFDFTSSGLLGIPGRMFFYGVPLATCLVLKFPEESPSKTRATRALAVGVLVLSRILAGFKSSALEVLTILFFGWSTTSARLGFWRVARRLTIPLIAGFIFAGVIYGTYASSTPGVTASAALVDRVFVNGSEPGALVLRNTTAVVGQESPWTEDIHYFAAKYFHLGSTEGSFAFNQRVSAHLYDLPLSASSYLVPVTVGGFPELVAQLGSTLGLLAAAVAGALYARIENLTRRAQSPVVYLLGIAAIFALHEFLTKGNGIYVLLNWGAVAAMLAVAQKLVSFRRERLENRA